MGLQKVRPYLEKEIGDYGGINLREILFKAKRLDNGEWVEGYVGYKGKGTEFEECHIMQSTFSETASPFAYPFYFTDIQVDPSTVCQYTGLNDKNGNKIFDWDKCRFFMENGSCSDSVGTVFWDTATAGFSVIGEESGSVNPFDIFYAENCEVIGNKYDKEE